MKKLIILFIIYLIEVSTSYSQTFFKFWDKAFGGNNAESNVNVHYLPNGQLIIVGESGSGISGDKTKPTCGILQNQDIWMIKADTAGNIIWDQDFGGENEEVFENAITQADGKTIFVTTSRSDSSCNKSEHSRDSVCCLGDYWIACTDSTGAMLWNKTYGGIATEYIGYTRTAVLSNGNIIICGRSVSPIGADKTVPNHGPYEDIWVVALDSSGNKLWDNVYGGIDDEASYSILPDDNSSFIIAGTVIGPASGDVSDTSRGSYDYWIIKIDSSGNKIWDKRFGGNGADQCYHITHTKNNGYIMCGITGSLQGLDVSDPPHGVGYDYWVIKIDSVGNKIWDKRYGGDNYNYAQWIEPDMDNGYLVAGYTNSNVSFEVSEPSYGLYDYWILKIDSVGNKIWDIRYGGPFVDYLYNFTILPDSSIVLCGAGFTGVSPVKTDSGDGDLDYWLVRFKYLPGTDGINESTNQHNSLTISPNLTKGKFILSTDSKTPGDVFIYDAIGKEIYKRKNILLSHYEIDISNFSNGVYFLKVKTGKDHFLNKVVKI